MSKKISRTISSNIQELANIIMKNPAMADAILPHASKKKKNPLKLVLGDAAKKVSIEAKGDEAQLISSFIMPVLEYSATPARQRVKDPKNFKLAIKKADIEVVLIEASDLAADVITHIGIRDPTGSTPTSCMEALETLSRRAAEKLEAQAKYLLCLARNFDPLGTTEGPFQDNLDPCRDEQTATGRANANYTAARNDVRLRCGF